MRLQLRLGDPARRDHHLRALRTAGLVASRRDGKMIMYTMTPVGSALVATLSAEVSA